jgi:methylglutaconyl-CoA hydratase
MNAFDERMIAELTGVFTALAASSATRVVVLAAEGKAFCAGADLQWMQRAAANALDDNLADARRFAAMMQAIATCARPVVAQVQGVAYGGGVGLCCAADIVVASEAAKFSVSEARFGILPAVIGPYLTNAVGKRHALRLALTAEVIDAHAAAQLGLVQHVADADALDAAVEQVVASLLGNGPGALGEIKQLYAQLEVGPVTPAISELTAQTIARVRSGDEAREGFAAFFAKRAASWVAQ